MIIHHLAKYIKMEGMRMGLFSEQTESPHLDFKKHWLHYQEKNVNAPSYAKNLYKAVVLYNSIHVSAQLIFHFNFNSLLEFFN